jgi:hypothetical protein
MARSAKYNRRDFEGQDKVLLFTKLVIIVILKKAMLKMLYCIHVTLREGLLRPKGLYHDLEDVLAMVEILRFAHTVPSGE